MILIGEKLNSSIPKTLEAFEKTDEAAVVKLIEMQAQAGASYLDINTAVCEDELDKMLWVIQLVQKHSDCGIMIDSISSDIIKKAAAAVSNRPLMINSTTITERFDTVVPLALEKGASIVALPIDDDGMPQTLEEKCDKIDLLVSKLRRAGMEDEKIFVDVLIETLATDMESAKTAIGAIDYIIKTYPSVNTTCGLSNISFGLPKRALINTAFVSAAMVVGLSSAILDPSSPSMRAALAAGQVVAGQDDYCMNYINYIREMEE